jgi:phosphohistidine phosphatase
MKLLIVRHADAGDRDEWEKSGRPDEERPLSKKGIEQIRAAAKGLVALVPEVDVIVTSPYTRAVQTAEHVRAAYGEKAELETTGSLEPDKHPDGFVEWLGDRDDDDTVVAVGHEPHLGVLATWCMLGIAGSRVEMKKGGACLLSFEKQPRKAGAVLQWLMGPKHLARVGAGS